MNDSVNSAKQSPADEPIKLPTMITVVGTVLVVGSIINIFAASVALRFPIYLYCDPSDHLKITPVWGYVSLGYVLSFVYGTVRGFFRTRNAPLRSPAESARRKREDQNIALLATALFGLEILGYIFLPSTRYVSATAIQFTSAIVAQLWIIRLYHESKFPWYLGSFKVFALGLMAQVLVLAWFNGAFMIHERLEYDPPVILNLKSDPAKPVTARIAYILGKYVVVETIKSEPS